MTRRVSICVLIPAYNARLFLREALDSVLAQTRPPEQIIVVDDGSTDGTAQVALEWQAERERPITLIRQENRGQSAARNAGIRVASGTNPPNDTLTITFDTKITDITGLRLEVLPDKTLPAQGPGRAPNGNFVLQEFRVELAAGQGDAEPEPLIALRPKGCVRVTVNRRAPSMTLDTSRATTVEGRV